MDARELGQKVLDIWSDAFRGSMNSGICEPGSAPSIDLYVNTPYGIWKLDDVEYNPEFGVMLKVIIEEYK